MSFLDRFKRKEQENAAPEGKPAPPSAHPLPPPSAPAPIRRPDMTNQTPAATVAAGYNPEFKLPPRKERDKAAAQETPKPSGEEGEMILELGDFLHRIPQQLLLAGSHDVHMVLKFNLNELADRIARGQTTVPLYEVYKRAPAVFREPILPSDRAEVRFPWQKVMKLLADAAGAASPGLTTSSVATLSDRLKSRRAVRNIIPGKGEPAAAPSPAVPAAETAPATPVLEPKLAPALAQPTLVSKEPDPHVGSEDDDQSSREELLRARDAARLQLARIKGEYERHLTAILQERKALAEERDKVVADLASSRKEIGDKLDQIAFEKSVAHKSGESLAHLQQEYEALQRDLQARQKEHEQEMAQAAKTAQGGDSRLAELAAERDALSQQKLHLSSQLAELTKKSPLKLVSSEAGAAGAGASPRQLEELQRRIGILENGQRDSAQELQREKEAKIKLERQLAAADRFKEESAHQMEEAVAAARRELEAAARKREAEAARLLKETQEHAETINAARTKLAAELAEARAKAATATAATAAEPVQSGWENRAVAQLESDIESYRGRIKTLLQERDALAVAKQKLQAEHEAQSQAAEMKLAAHGAASAKVSQLELELTEVARAKEELARSATDYHDQLTAMQHGLATSSQERDEAKAAAAQLRAENEKLSAQVQAAPSVDLAPENQRLAEEVAASRAAAEMAAAQLRDEARKLAGERDLALKEGEKLLTEIEDLKTARDQSADETRRELQQRIEAQERSLRESATERESLAGQVTTLAAALQDAQGAQQRAGAAKEEIASQYSAANAELAQLREKVTSLAADLEAAKLQHGDATAAIDRDRAARESLAHELETMRAAHARAADELRTERDGLSAQASALTTELKEAHAAQQRAQEAKTELAAQQTTAIAELGKLREKNAGLLADLEAARQQHGDAAAAIERDRAARENLAAELQTLRTAHEKALGTIRSERDQLAAEASAMRAAHERALVELRTEHDQTRTAKVELATRHASLTAEHDRAQAKLTGLQNDLAVAKAHHSDASAALERDRSAREGVIADLAKTRSALEKLRTAHSTLEGKKKDLDGQLARAQAKDRTVQARLEEVETALRETQAAGKTQEENAALSAARHDVQLQEIQAKHERALAALAADKDATIAGVHAEKTALASATDKQIATLMADHEKALAVLAAEKTQELVALDARRREEIATVAAEREEKAANWEKAEEKIAGLQAQIETAGSEATGLTQQMANAAILADKKYAATLADRDRLAAEKAALVEEFEEARDTHKAQSTVFTREFKTVIAQRDEAVSELEAQRKHYEEKSAQLAHERASRTKFEEEVATRFERDLARLRRERDNVAQQRDSLRSRIGQLITEQQKLLDDVASEATHTAARHAEALPPPATSRRSESKSKSRVEKETNVIDISTAEVLPIVREEDNGLKIPRIRPVSVPPPQVRSL